MSGCLLCLEIRQDLVGSIQVSSKQWQELNIQILIETHFWPMDELHTSDSWLCMGCWQELYNFHKFYVRVEDAHAELGSGIRNVVTKFVNIDDAKSEEDFKLSIEKSAFGETHVKEAYVELSSGMRTVVTNCVDPDDMITEEDFKPSIEKSAFTETHFESENSLKEAIPLEYLVDDDNIITKEEEEHKRNENIFHTIEGESNLNISNIQKIQEEKDTKPLESTKSDIEKLQSIEFMEILDKRNSDYSDTNSNYELGKDISAATTKQKRTNHEDDEFLSENFKIICCLCQFHSETFHDLCVHFRTEHRQAAYIICCKKKFYRRGVLADHVRQHLNPDYFKCKICGKVMVSRRFFNMHIENHNNKKEKIHVCEICNNKFDTPLALNMHKLSHLSEDEKHVPCKECGKKFANKRLLSSHVRVVHLRRYINVCDICGKSIRCKDVFERHVLQHKGKPVPTITCDICGLILASKTTLRKHKLRVHAEGKGQEFTCPVCAKISSNLRAHKIHIKYNHEAGYHHKCEMCERVFKTPQTLKEHIATHTGTVLYTCPWCPKTYISSSSFYSHRRKSHPKEREEEKRKKYSDILVPKYNAPSANNSDTNDSELSLEKTRRKKYSDKLLPNYNPPSAKNSDTNDSEVST